MKDLGKGLGLYVIVINCSEGLDYKSIGKMFAGEFLFSPQNVIILKYQQNLTVKFTLFLRFISDWSMGMF